MSQIVYRSMLLGIATAMIGLSACQPITRPDLDAVSAAQPGEAHQSSHAPHWRYEGAEGPAQWGDLSEEFATCATGHQQSPIDLANEVAVDLPDLTFHYQPSAINIVNNGHTIQVNYDTGSTIEVDDVVYTLQQFHFHAHSEHTIRGESFPLEIHLVHQNEDGQLAVVGLMAEAGATDDPLNVVWANLPMEAHQSVHVDGQINAADLLPIDHTYYGYAGSLTTPPCSEGVKWHILTTPIQFSTTQLDTMAALLQDNFRPVQPLNERAVALDTSAIAGR